MADIEFVDREFGHIRVPASRKIKFKQVSFTNISKRFNKFRLNRLTSKLISQKEKLVSMEFDGSKLVPGKSREKVERKILNKTAAIARLESKINFLETGNYLSEDFVSSRAIKLKETMMNNLEYNRGNLYGVNKDTKEEILNDTAEPENIVLDDSVIQTEQEPEVVSSTADTYNAQEPEVVPSTADTYNAQEQKDQEQVVAKVKQIMDENQQIDNIEIPQPSIIPVVPTEPITEAGADVVIGEEVPSTKEKNKNDDVKPINAEELAAAINEEMNNIKVSSNESSPAKVNKFINADGTYHLKREDMDEDLRITRFDRSQLPADFVNPLEKAMDENHQKEDSQISQSPIIPIVPTESFVPMNAISDEMDNMTIANPSEEIEEPVVEPFAENVVERKVPSMEIPRRAITEIPETKKYVIEPLVTPTIKESFFTDLNSPDVTQEQGTEKTSDTIKELALVVPDREVVKEESDYENHQEEIKGIELGEDIQKYLNKATVLSNDKKRIEEGYAQEEATLQQTEERYDATVGKFVEYVNSLESECNESFQRLQKTREEIQSKEEQITLMVNMMAGGFSPETTKAKSK